MNKVREFFADFYKVGMTVFELLLLLSMAFNPELEFNHFTYFTLVSRCLFPFIVFFFGYKGMWIFFFIVTSINVLDITFNDFTALSAFCILFLFIPEDKKFMKPVTVIVYLINIFIVATLHNKQPYHLFAHFIGCGMLVLTVYRLKNGKVEIPKFTKQLDLTNDERIILEELKKGKRQKEIDLFSENTVCNKLKEARKRNNLASTEELLQHFN